MSFFSKVKNTVSNTGQGIAKKTSETIEIMKLSNTIKENEKEIQKLYLEMGTRLHLEFSDTSKEKFPEIVDRIMVLETEIKKSKDDIIRLNGEDPNVPRCKNCNAFLKQGQIFCIKCGTKISE